MATLSENFDSYSDGDLNGQGSWSGGVLFDIQGTVTQAGAKAVINAGATNSSVIKSFTLTAAGYQGWYIRTSDKTKDAVHQTRLYESGSAKAYIKVNNGNMQYFNGAAYVTFGTVVNDTWHHIEMEWDASTDQARYKFDGGSWTAWANLASTLASGMDGFGCVHDGSGSANNYWDTITNSGATNVTVTPTAQVDTFSIPAYTVKRGWVTFPFVQVDTFSIPPPTVSLPKVVSVNPQVATFSIPSYNVIMSGVIVQANPQTVTFSIPAYQVKTYALVMPNGQTLTFTVPAYTIVVEANITISPNTLVLTLTTPSRTKVGAVWVKRGRSTNATWVKSTRNSN